MNSVRRGASPSPCGRRRRRSSTADSTTSCAPTASASRCASVVLPVPAGPHRTIEGRVPAVDQLLQRPAPAPPGGSAPRTPPASAGASARRAAGRISRVDLSAGPVGRSSVVVSPEDPLGPDPIDQAFLAGLTGPRSPSWYRRSARRCASSARPGHDLHDRPLDRGHRRVHARSCRRHGPPAGRGACCRSLTPPSAVFRSTRPAPGPRRPTAAPRAGEPSAFVVAR